MFALILGFLFLLGSQGKINKYFLLDDSLLSLKLTREPTMQYLFFFSVCVGKYFETTMAPS